MLKNVKKILVPVDFSDNAPKVFAAAANVAAKFGAELTAVFVVQSFEEYVGFYVPHMPVMQFQAEMREGAEKRMTDFLEANLPPGQKGQGKVLEGDVGEGIVSFAEQEKMDMIVMGTHGYKGLERVLFGSVAEQVVKTATCPVLTVNPCR